MSGSHESMMAELREVFLQEATEGLELTEARLLDLDRVGELDDEAINEVFRAVHSIKGGSGTFGYTKLIGFTHVMETLLDAVRSRQRELDAECVDVLLQSVDHVRAILDEESGGGPVDVARTQLLQGQLEALFDGPAAVGPAASSEAEAAPAPSGAGWRVRFAPHESLMHTGNDPLILIRELRALAEGSIVVDPARLPAFEDLAPENFYLAWTAQLHGDVQERAIREIFEWVEDDADLELTRLDEAPAPEAAPAAAPEPEAEPAPVAAPPPPEAPAAKAAPSAKAATPAVNKAHSIRVDTDKVDDLINLVGELVITQSMLGEVEKNFTLDKLEDLRVGLAQLERNTRELQEGVMRIRMLPIGFVFSRFPRIVRDLSKKLDKQVDLQMTGEGTELDKTVLERISDPLVHILRNSMDHGLETSEQRVAAGKSEVGLIHMHAFHQGGSIHIRISDDGRGLDVDKIRDRAIERELIRPDAVLDEQEVIELLFAPGFSTAEKVSDVSGRGVGLDVVRRNIKALGGHIDLSTVRGQGTTFTIRLPLTLSILDGQLVQVGDETYIIPLVSIVESTQVVRAQVKRIAGRHELYRMRDEYLPILRLYEEFGATPNSTRLDEGILVVVEGNGRQACLFVDDLLEQQQVVIKSLETNFEAIPGVSGATILGNGQVALILDVTGLIDEAGRIAKKAAAAKRAA